MNDFSIYTKPIVEEALKRNIKVRGFTELNNNLAILELNGHLEYISQSITSLINYPLFKIIFNKYTSYKLLKEKGFNVPETLLTKDINEAFSFLKLHKKIVVKPTDQSGGDGITINIDSKEKLIEAVKFAQNSTASKNKKILVQEHLEGDDHRILVINKQEIFGIKRVPAFITGDGVNTINELIKIWNKKVPKNRQINIIKVKKFLKENNQNIESILTLNQTLKLSTLANSHQGGLSYDITDDLSIEIKNLYRSIAKTFNIPVVGIDIISKDINNDIGKIVELNPHPGITIHRNPTFGKKRYVEKYIIDMLFPESII